MIADGYYIVYEDGSDPVYITLSGERIVRQVCAGELALHRAARDGRDGIEIPVATATAAAIAGLLDPTVYPELVQVYRLTSPHQF